MNKRPIIFPIQSIIFLTLAASLPLQIYFREGFTLTEWTTVLRFLSPLNWITMITFTTIAYCSWNALPILKLFLPLSFTVVAINNFFALDLVMVDHESGQTILDRLLLVIGPATIFYSAFLYLVLFKSNQAKILEYPSGHWWKIPPRFKLDVPVWFARPGEKLYKTKTLDVAKGGLFIPFYDEDLSTLEHHVGDLINIHLQLEGKIFQCKARCARVEKAKKGKYPAGLGLQFVDLDFDNKRLIGKFLTSVEKAQKILHAS